MKRLKLGRPKSKMQEKKGFSNGTVGLMIGVALIFDLLQFLLGFLYMGWLAGIFAALTFWLWFYMKGVKINFSNLKRLAGFAGTSLIETIPIPFVASLPAWTAFIVITALKNKIQEKVESMPGGKIIPFKGSSRPNSQQSTYEDINKAA